ncbi:Rv1733c family protein [Streptomyces sp. NPDC054887]
MRTACAVWRRRHSPLCRTTDLAEAWVTFAAVLLIVLAAPTAGWLCGTLTHEALRESVRAQQEQRHRTTAHVVDTATEPVPLSAPEAPSERTTHTRVLARWTAYDGSRRTGVVATTEPVARPGDRFRMWTDDEGRPVGRPLDDATASTHAAIAGVGAATAAAALFEGGRRLVVRRLVLRRYARLDQEWAQTGPDWGRTGAGS